MPNQTLRNLYLFELSDVFAGQVYLPYSSGVVWSYLRSKSEIGKNYRLAWWFYHRQDLADILAKIEDPDILLFSCFMWNWNLSCQIAKAVKAVHPNARVIFGGQHQPLPGRDPDFFKTHPYVDYLIHHEGEESVYEILAGRDHARINGITYNDGGRSISTSSRARMKNVGDMPSPYLDGSFDELLQSNQYGLVFHATVESTRGCPFSCAFCEIGDEYYKSLEKSHERTKSELKWIADNKIEYVTDASSNFGIFYEEDMKLAEYVGNLKKDTGFPLAYRVTWAKGQSKAVLPIARYLQEKGLQKGMTIALQSLNKSVLDAIRRKNVSGEKIQEFIQTYETNGIHSYVELIWGLPKETLESFIDGVASIMESGFHNYLDIHIMMLLPNAPLARQEVIDKYEIEVLSVQPRFPHRSNPEILVDDLIDIVVKTSSMSLSDWIDGFVFRWLVIFGHYLGPLQYIARAIISLGLDTYKGFYLKLLSHVRHSPNTFLGAEYSALVKSLGLILENNRYWGDLVDEAGDINWDFDEATCIRIAQDKEEFYKQQYAYLAFTYGDCISEALLKDIVLFQSYALSSPFVDYPRTVSLNHDVESIVLHGASMPYRHKVNYKFSAESHASLYEWAKQTLWFGRRTAKYKATVEKFA